MKKIYFVIAIIFIGAFLRIYALDQVPSGFFRDEAAISYNAYSLWHTGKDEYGISYPLVFRSFEVFFLPFYTYLTAPIVGLFGLSIFTSRILSSISGVIALLLAYLLGKKIWQEKSGVFSVFLLAIAPWHIYYSRATFEGNLALTLFTGGFYLWIRFLKEKSVKMFFCSTLLFALSMYSYQAPRLVVPLFAFIAALMSKDLLWRMKSKLIVSFVAILIVLLPLLSLSAKAGGYHRAFGVSFFAKEENAPGWVAVSEDTFFLNNKLYLRTRQFLALYLSYFSPKNLYSQGDFDQQRSVVQYSVFYWWLFPFLLLGTTKMFRTKKKSEKLLLVWTFLAPLPAALTADPFHTYRSLLLFMPLTLIQARGLEYSYSLLPNKKIEKFISLSQEKTFYTLFILFVSLISLSFFGFYYIFVNRVVKARYWDYGYAQIVDFVDKNRDHKIVVDDPLTQGYVHYLFFGKVEPIMYQKEVSKLGEPKDYYYTNPKKIRPRKIGHVEFREVDWPKERGDSGTIFVMWDKRLPDSEFINDPNVKLLKEIKYPSGETAYKIVEII